MFGQTRFWTEVICLQHLLIEHLQKSNFFENCRREFHFYKREIYYSTFASAFFCRREIIWVKKTDSHKKIMFFHRSVALKRTVHSNSSTQKSICYQYQRWFSLWRDCLLELFPACQQPPQAFYPSLVLPVLLFFFFSYFFLTVDSFLIFIEK